MLGLEDFMTIQALVKRGVYLCDIAEQLGVHPRTVRRAVHRGGPHFAAWEQPQLFSEEVRAGFRPLRK